jgi:hypothetical protein
MLGRARCALLATALVASGCTKRLYEGPPLPREQIAGIHVGTAIVREIDGQSRRGGALDVGYFEITPGRHRLALVFELPPRNIGVKLLPAQAGVGTCWLEFTAEAGKQYYLGTRARGEAHTPRWDGSWEGWLRDPTMSSADDVIARCEPQALTPTPTATAAPAIAAGTPTATVAPPRAAAAPRAPDPATIRIGTWNLASRASAQRDLGRVGAAIDANFDIVAISEVSPGDYDALLRSAGSGWAGMIGAASGEAAYDAILYRSARVRPCPGWAALGQRDGTVGDSGAASGDCFEAELVDVGTGDRAAIAVRVRHQPQR